jgi:surface protein
MEGMFGNSKFNCDISQWNVSNVTNMKCLFLQAKFSGDISKLDVSNVYYMEGMFANSEFNGDISKWNVSNVENMNNMFTNSKFNKDISLWEIFSNCEIDDMFSDCLIKKEYKPKSLINEAFDFNAVTKQKKVINAHDILFNDKLKNIVYKIVNKPTLGTKDREFILSLPDASYTANDEEFPRLIQRCIKYFGKDCNLNWIDTSEITCMNKLFNPKEWDQTYFYGDISKWNVSNVKDMSKLFHRTDFNGDISNWDVSNVKDMNNMFAYSNFNGDISKWDVSRVLDM